MRLFACTSGLDTALISPIPTESPNSGKTGIRPAPCVSPTPFSSASTETSKTWRRRRWRPTRRTRRGAGPAGLVDLLEDAHGRAVGEHARRVEELRGGRVGHLDLPPGRTRPCRSRPCRRSASYPPAGRATPRRASRSNRRPQPAPTKAGRVGTDLDRLRQGRRGPGKDEQRRARHGVRGERTNQQPRHDSAPYPEGACLDSDGGNLPECEAAESPRAPYLLLRSISSMR